MRFACYIIHIYFVSLSTKADNFINIMSRALMTGRHNIHAMLHYFKGYHFNQCVTHSSSLAKRITFKETNQALNFIHAAVCLCSLVFPPRCTTLFFSLHQVVLDAQRTHSLSSITFSTLNFFFDLTEYLTFVIISRRRRVIYVVV